MPASRPAWALVPLLISCLIAASMASYWVARSIKLVMLATLLKITTPTLTRALVFSIWAFSVWSISRVCCSRVGLVDLSSTNTMSVTSCSSAEGRDRVTLDSKFASRFVAVLERETTQSGPGTGSTGSTGISPWAAFRATALPSSLAVWVPAFISTTCCLLVSAVSASQRLPSPSSYQPSMAWMAPLQSGSPSRAQSVPTLPKLMAPLL